MLIPLIALLVFASVVLVFRGLQMQPADPVELRLRAVQAGIRPRNSALAQPFIRRSVAPMASGLARFIMRILPQGWIKDAGEKIVWAGNPITLPGYVLIWMSMTAALGFVAYVFTGAIGFSGLMQMITTIAGFGVGFWLPQAWLRSRIANRHYLARKGLPDALDLMTTSVEAGLSLDSAMIRVAEYQRGPFQDELAIALQDMTLGKSRRQALEEITERINVPEVISFVQTINQAEVTGAPVAQVLRVQCEQVRIQRRQHAEAQAQRAPLLMLIPLILFIFPSLFIVLLAPVALTVIDMLGNNELLR